MSSQRVDDNSPSQGELDQDEAMANLEKRIADREQAGADEEGRQTGKETAED